jgi:DNA-binding NtrC family response regulator
LDVPSLNERREDIPLLANFFAEKKCQRANSNQNFEDKAIKLLQEYDWTGNIRELRNVENGRLF